MSILIPRNSIGTIRELRQLDPQVLHRHFGRQGEHLWRLAHGIDDRSVVSDREAKSVSHETTFPIDISDREALRAWILELTEHVGRRLRRNELRGRTVHLKLRFADFRTITRAHTLPQPTDITREIDVAATELLERALPARFAIRLLGVGVSGFENREQVQQSLFADEDRQKQGRLDAVADEIRAKFGATGLGRGSGMLHEAKHRSEARPGEPERKLH